MQSTQKTYERAMNLMKNKHEYQDYIQQIVDVVEKKSPDSKLWQWSDAPIQPAKFSKLIQEGIIKKATNKVNRLVDYDATKKALTDYQNYMEATQDKCVNDQKPTTEDIENLGFDSIVGHEKKKKVIKMALKAETPVHIMLIGEEGTSKTMFLREIAFNLPNAKYYSGGGQMTRAGLANMLVDQRPDYLLLDELDEIGKNDLAILNGLMETGIVSQLKYDLNQETSMNTKVFAALNPWDLKRIPKDLYDRFRKIRFKPYSEKEFRKVVSHYLVNRQGVNQQVAEYIAQQLVVRQCKSVREAIGVSNMCSNKQDVDDALDVLVTSDRDEIH